MTPNLFGNYYDAFLADLPWMGALNFARDPFFYSLYVGPFVLILALFGVAGGSAAMRSGGRSDRVRRRGPGRLHAAYPLLRKLVPPLMYFRFPVKYIVFAVFACAVLAAEGLARLLIRRSAAVAYQASPGAWPRRRSPALGRRASPCRI